MNTKLTVIGIFLALISIVIGVVTLYDGNEQPIPSIQKSPGPYLINTEIEFSASNSKDPDGEIISHVWNFGDGMPNESGEIVTHTYTNSGTYEISLTVKDNSGTEVPKDDKIVILDDQQEPVTEVTEPVTEEKETSNSIVDINFCKSHTDEQKPIQITDETKLWTNSPYSSFGDSPFFNSKNFIKYFYCDDFEDSSLNTQGITNSGGRVIKDGNYEIHSVNYDDGEFSDGGSSGGLLFTTGSNTAFTFNKMDLGEYPTHVGFVLTTAYKIPVYNNEKIVLEVYYPDKPTPDKFGPFQSSTSHEDDTFIGITNSEGIKEIKIILDNHTRNKMFMIDHIQYGR